MIRTEIFVNNTKIDLFEDLPMSLNYQIADITEPDKRNSSFSKTITIPGSKENNKVFSHIWDISKEALSNNETNFTPDFNPNKKADCIIYIDSIEVFNGTVRLLKVIRVGQDISYEVSVLGQLANIFLSMGEKLLTDYDFSDFNHDLTKANQQNSWDTSIIKDGIAYNNFTGAVTAPFANGEPNGVGYVYPLINYGFNEVPLNQESSTPTQMDTNFKVLNQYPAIYLKEYLDTIFEEEGFTYTSTFFDSVFFKKLIIPFSGEVLNLTTAQADARKFETELTTDRTNVATIKYSGADKAQTGRQGKNVANFDPAKFDDDSTPPNFDTNGVYDTATGFYTVNIAGEYGLSTTCTMNHDLTIPASASGAEIIRTFRLGIWKREAATNQLINLALETAKDVYLVNSPPASNTTPDYTITASINNVELEAGDKIYVSNTVDVRAQFPGSFLGRVKDDVTGTFNTLSTATAGTDTKFFNTVLSTTPTEGDTLAINGYVPKKIKAKDLFLAVIKAFNLYVDVDKNNEKNLLIEPLVDFYDNNSTLDWSSKLHTDGIEIKPVSEIKGKEYKFTYTPDTDFYNLLYTGRNEEIYGEESLEIDNDFVTGVKEFKLLFSPTPTVGNFENDLVIPKMYDLSDNGVPDPRINKIRLLQYGGVLSVGGEWAYLSDLAGDSVETTYPYSGHLDHPFSPTSDINWGVPNEVFWGGPDDIGSNYPTNNLFNTYWRIFIDEITDKDAKIVEAQFNLKPIDIFKLDFRNFVFVEGLDKQIFRINKIKSYNPTKNGLTRVELTKVKNKDPFVPSFVTLGNSLTDPINFNILEGGYNEIRNIAATNPELIVDGEIDAVRDLSDTVGKFIVTGS